MTYQFSFITSNNDLGKEGSEFLANGLKELKNLSLLSIDLK